MTLALWLKRRRTQNRHRRRGHAVAVSGSSLSISGAASVGLSSATGITGSTLTINTANAGIHHGGRRVHGDIDGLERSNRGELRGHRGAYGRHADHHRGGLRGPAASTPVVNTSVQFTSLVAAHVALRGEPVQRGRARASKSASRSVTETDSPSKAEAAPARGSSLRLRSAAL